MPIKIVKGKGLEDSDLLPFVQENWSTKPGRWMRSYLKAAALGDVDTKLKDDLYWLAELVGIRDKLVFDPYAYKLNPKKDLTVGEEMAATCPKLLAEPSKSKAADSLVAKMEKASQNGAQEASEAVPQEVRKGRITIRRREA